MHPNGGGSNPRDVEALKEYQPFEDDDTKIPKVMSFEQEGGNGTVSLRCDNSNRNTLLQPISLSSFSLTHFCHQPHKLS